MKTNSLLLRSILCIAFFSLTITTFGADFYWKTNAVDNSFTNPANWTDITGTTTPTGSDGQLRPWSGDNVFFTQATSTFMTINCTGGKCLNVNLPNAGIVPYTFQNELNVFGSINSPVDRLVLALGSKIVFDGSGAKTIQLTNTFVANNYINFDFRGDGTYTLIEDLNSTGNTGVFRLLDDAQVITNGLSLNLNTIKFNAPAVSASMNLDGSNVRLYEGIFYGEWNGTLPPGPGVSVSAVNTTLELCVIYNNSGAQQSITGMERILFRPGTSYPVVSSSGTTIQSDTIYVDANTFGANSDLTCDYFELLRPTAISGVTTGAIRFNDFIVPPACSGTSSLNFASPVSIYTFQNTSGASKTIDMLFKNVNFTGSNVNSNSTNDQGGNIGSVTWGASPVGLSFYWVGGAGDWNDPTQWSIISSGGMPQLGSGCIPTLLDDVYFDANSFSAAGQNVTNVNSTPLFSRNVYWTAGNLAGIAGGTSQFYNWYIAGSADFSGMNTTVGAKAYLYMIGSGTHTFNPPNMAYPRSIHFEGSGSYDLLNDLSILPNNNFFLNHRNGILNTNGYSISAHTFSSFPLASGISRELNMDGSVFNLTNFFLSSGLITNFSATGSEINLNSSASELTIYDGYSGFTAPVTLANMILPKVSFMSTTGTPRILYGSNVISITEMNVTPNLQQIFGGIRVGTLNLTGGTTVSIQNIRIADAVNVSGIACSDLVTLKSNTSGSQGSLFKPTGTFTIDRAYIQDITAAAGVPLTVTNGVDGGNNTSVTVGAGTPRNFYWVGNSGNWNDGGHWSINASGVPYPAVSTNPSGCIPTAIDNVFFDNASFDISGQTVTITSDANCKNMDWTGSGIYNPILGGNNTTLQLNIYGSITLANNLSWTFNGFTNMRGSNLAVNSQTLDFQGVNMGGRLRFNGGGRYDFINDVSIYNVSFNTFGWQDGSFILTTGEVYCNGYNLSATSILLYLTAASNYFDATNCTINTERLWSQHGGNTTNYSFANSQVTTSIPSSSIFIEATVPTNYHNFTLAGSQLNASNTINAQRVTQTNLVTTTTGNWVMDTLILAQSSSNTFQAGRTYTVNDTLIAFGTPCIPVILKADGGTATYESTSQNTLIQFGSLQNMTASLAPSGSSPAGYQVIGADVGGNSNWSFSPAASLPYLGAYNVSANCDALPFGVTTAGFSPVPGTTYAWNTGSTASTLDLDSSGVYIVSVSYAASCSVIDSIEFTIANTVDVQPASVLMPDCFADSTGAISATVLGGNNNFDYTWTSPTGNPFTINPTDSTQLSNLSAGTYQIIVNQTNNPVCADTLSIAITEPTLLVPDLTSASLACNGDTDGAITATGTGGTPGYQVSIDGGAFNPAPFNFTGLNAGNYEIVVQDLNGCLDTITQAIAEPALLTSAANNTPILCNGETNGSIDLTINGGTPTYQVSVNGGGFAPSASTYGSLSAGSYQLIIEDQNGCRDTVNQVIAEPAVLIAATTPTDLLCNGDSNGSIDLTINGGISAYNVSVNGGTFSPSSATYNGLTAGNYQFVVEDQNGCRDTINQAITEPAALVSATNASSLLCNGDSNGSIDLTISGGVSAYNVSVNGGTFSPSSATYTGLTAGSYQFVVEDQNGCRDTINQAITEPAVLIAATTANDLLCNGDLGSIDLTINGGISAYNVSVNGGAFSPSSATYTGLTAGNYQFVVEDQNGCRDTVNQAIAEPTVLIAATTASDLLCNGDSNGSIDLTINGGISAYNVSVNGGTFSPSSATYTGLTAGNYQFVVEDQNGCRDTINQAITEPAALVSATNASSLLCNGDSNGSIDLTISGGVSAYNVSVNGGAFSPSSATYTGLTAGNYQFVVEDQNGCRDTINQAITEPAALVASTSTAALLCNGDANGSIDLTINGGISAYNVSVNGGAFSPSSATYTGLTAGNYQFVVEDQNGCRDTVNQAIIEPAVLVTNATITSNYNGADVSCNGLTDGAISSSTTGGTVNYNYSWNTTPVQTTPNLTNVGAGSYTLTVTDQNGCISQSTVTVTEPAALSDSYVVDQDANCNVADGAATITTLGGTPNYTYSWSNNPGNTTNVATDLAAGITNVTITDANGCTDNVSVSINSINAPISYLSADSVLCLGGSTGIAMVDSVSGNGGYTFIWSDNLGNPIGQTNDTATGLPAGTYSVQVTDQNGCSSVQTVVVDEPTTTIVIAILNVVSPACNASTEGSITVSASGGTGTIDYTWNTTPVQTTPSITNLPEGTYIVTATDANGCSIDETVQITAPTPLVLTSTQSDVSCFNGTDGAISITAQGGTPAYTYVWTGSSSTTDQATALASGNYSVLVNDANGCEDSLSFIITEPTALIAEILSSKSPDCGISNGTITIDVNGGTPNYSFLWNDGSTNQDNTAAASGMNSVLITDQNGCTQSLEIELSCILFEIPELLTPNNDGKNDLWAITGLENFPNTQVQIFNRWGTKVFGSDDYQNNWDGRSESNLNIAGDELPESSYFYVLTLGGAENDPNNGKVFKGYIYIKRN